MPKNVGSAYGKTTEQNPAVSKFARLSENNPTGPVEWAEVDGRLIKAAIIGACSSGAALVFSCTSDGGALAVTLLDGKERVKKYFSSAQLAESWLTEVATLANG